MGWLQASDLRDKTITLQICYFANSLIHFRFVSSFLGLCVLFCMFMKLLHSEDLEESKGAILQSDDGLSAKMFPDLHLLATTGGAVSGGHVW